MSTNYCLDFVLFASLYYRRLQGFIVDDASTILNRQEADSIPILDEICTKIKKLFFRRIDRDFRVERLRSLAIAIGFNVYYVEDDYDDD